MQLNKVLIQKIKATLFVHAIRPFLKENENRIMKCPVCGDLLQWYDDYGWLHLVDGDADCYGALSYGKGKKR
jgi:hypothetical protein